LIMRVMLRDMLRLTRVWEKRAYQQLLR